jgi:hypothetical protein
MRSSLLASVDVMEFQTTEAYSNLDLTKVKYNNNNNDNNNRRRRRRMKKKKNEENNIPTEITLVAIINHSHT